MRRPGRSEQQRDERAVAERAYRLARRAALGVTGSADAADDVAQEVVIELIRSRRAGRPPEQLDGWIHRVATRTAIRTAKRERRRRDRELRHAELDRPPGVRDGGVAAALSLLDDMPERQRAAMTLRYVLDLDDAAIGRALGCRETTVRSLLSRGRATLRARLTDPLPMTIEEPTCL